MIRKLAVEQTWDSARLTISGYVVYGEVRSDGLGRYYGELDDHETGKQTPVIQAALTVEAALKEVRMALLRQAKKDGIDPEEIEGVEALPTDELPI